MTINSFADALTASMQDIFDQVVGRLLAQGNKSMRDGNCDYISSDGCRCAIGHLMSEKEAYYYLGEAPCCIEGWKDMEYSRSLLLNQLMDCHDDLDVEEWPDEFRLIAERFSLEYRF